MSEREYKCESCGNILTSDWCGKCQKGSLTPLDSLDARTRKATEKTPPAQGAAPHQVASSFEAMKTPSDKPGSQQTPVHEPVAKSTAMPMATDGAHSPQTTNGPAATRFAPADTATVKPIDTPARATNVDSQGSAPPPRISRPSSRTEHPGEKEVGGLKKFHLLLEAGYQTVVMCGTSKTGKSQIVEGFTRANTILRRRAQYNNLDSKTGLRQELGGTLPKEVWYQIVNTGHRGNQRIFLDPSGEFFRRLVPQERAKEGLGELTPDYFNFVRQAVNRLAGLVLVFDLTNRLSDYEQAPWRNQEDNFNSILPALRWLRFEKNARPEDLGVELTIASRVSHLNKLDVPVLILFSKADQLAKYSNQTPLDFARDRLPFLHGAVSTHATRFHYDFCHTMIDTAQGRSAVERPCGVLLAMEWLLEPPLRWLPRLPARWLGGTS